MHNPSPPPQSNLSVVVVEKSARITTQRTEQMLCAHEAVKNRVSDMSLIICQVHVKQLAVGFRCVKCM